MIGGEQDSINQSSVRYSSLLPLDHGGIDLHVEQKGNTQQLNHYKLEPFFAEIQKIPISFNSLVKSYLLFRDLNNVQNHPIRAKYSHIQVTL